MILSQFIFISYVHLSSATKESRFQDPAFGDSISSCKVLNIFYRKTLSKLKSLMCQWESGQQNTDPKKKTNRKQFSSNNCHSL